MDTTKLEEALEAEHILFTKTVQTAINEAKIRRSDMKTFVSEVIGLNLNNEMSEDDFFSAVDTLQKISSLDMVWEQVGFSDDSYRTWTEKKCAPKTHFRRPTVQILLDAIIDYYADAKLTYELSAILEGWEFSGDQPESPIDSRALLLSKYLDHMKEWHKLSRRTTHPIEKKDIMTIGELVSQSETQLMEIHHFGPKALDEVKLFLKRFALSLDCLSETEKEQVRIRRFLNENAGKPLVTTWRTFEGRERQETTISADSEMLEALKKAGITEQTELATAPREVIESICSNHGEWLEQLPKLLKTIGRNPDVDWLKYPLQLYLQVPPFLSENVKVYREK